MKLRFTKLSLLKLALIMVSFTIYAYLWTWQFALLIIMAIGLHEQGHVWATRRLGMPSYGWFMVPFMGGISIGGGPYICFTENVIVAIMGPIWGMLLAFATWIIYLATDMPIFAAAAYWQALINLFNLLPVHPLDGGQITRGIAFSFSKKLGYVLSYVALPIFVFLCWKTHLWIFGLLAFFSLMEIRNLSKIDLPMPMPLKQRFYAITSYVVLAIILFLIVRLTADIPGADLTQNFLTR